MTRLIHTGLAIMALALSVALPRAACAQEPPPAGGDAKPEKVIGVVKLDIDEQLDGKPFRDTAATVRLRKKLRELGFKVWTEKTLYVDEFERKKKEKGAPAAPSGTAAPTPAAPADEKPAPDLVVKGTIVVKLDRSSTFFGGSVAFMYAGVIDLTISDRSGKALARVSEKDEWGKTDEKKAREDEIRRAAAFAALGVLRAEPVNARLTPKGKASVEEYAAEVAKNYPKSAPEGETPADAPKGGEKPAEGGEKKQ